MYHTIYAFSCKTAFCNSVSFLSHGRQAGNISAWVLQRSGMCHLPSLLLVTGERGMTYLWLVHFSAAHKYRMPCSFQLWRNPGWRTQSCFLLVVMIGKTHTGFSQARNTYSACDPWELQMNFKVRLSHGNHMIWSTQDNSSSNSSP